MQAADDQRNGTRSAIRRLGKRARRAAGAVARIVLDRDARSAWLTRLRAADAIHQDTTQTWPDRYPLLFRAARAAIAQPHPTILSFGCSSGEEVVSLRHYFPDARIVGAEINRACLAQCRRRIVDHDIVFVEPSRDTIAAHGPYDAIFCMAVFQRRPHEIEKRGIVNIARHYPFNRFADDLGFLAGQLRAGGLLIVEHAQYRVEDLAASLSLVPVDGEGIALAKGPRFDPAGDLIVPQPTVSRLFRSTARDRGA